MGGYAKKVLNEFLEQEFLTPEIADGFIRFVLDEYILSGEQRGNEFVVQKLDYTSYLLFREYIDPERMCPELHDITAFTKDELLDAMYEKRAQL